MALITIGGVEIPTPSTYKSTIEDFVDSARNQNGVVIGAIIREDVAKVEITWLFLDSQKCSHILNLITKKFNGGFYNDVTFYDVVSGEYVTRKMYIGSRNSDMYQLNADGSVRGFTNCRIALIEV